VPIDAGVRSARGAACSPVSPCSDGLTCLTGLHALGGYCASVTCAACDGACVGTADGELCMAPCTRDAQCRTSEGYVCDRAWHACLMPNAAAIVPRTCPAPRGIGRNPQFAPTEVLFDGNEFAATVRADGTLLAVSPSQLGASAREPAIVRAGNMLHAVWRDSGVMFASSTDGATWSAPAKLDDAGTRPRIVAGGGVLYVLYAHEGLRARSSRDGGKSWDAATTLMPAGAGNAVLGTSLHVAGIDGGPLGAYGSANQRVLYGNAVVSQRDEVLPFYFATPSIAVDGRRKWVYIAYVRGGRDAIWDIALVASKDAGKTWTRARIGDDPACAIHMVPALAVDETTGTLHVAWYDGRGDKGRIGHATCTAGLGACTQTGRINDVPFGALSTVRETSASLGDRIALLVDDKRRMLHAVWSQPVDGVARVYTAKAKLPLR
jgi:hypothetical protein